MRQQGGHRRNDIYRAREEHEGSSRIVFLEEGFDKHMIQHRSARNLLTLVLLGLMASGMVGCMSIRAPFFAKSESQFGHLKNNTSGPLQSEIIQTSSQDEKTPIVELSHLESPAPSAWSRLLNRFGKRERIPLPRTDLPLEDDIEDETQAVEPSIDSFWKPPGKTPVLFHDCAWWPSLSSERDAFTISPASRKLASDRWSCAPKYPSWQTSKLPEHS